MTITTDGSPVHTEEDFVREHRRNRGLLVAVVVLAAAVVALVGWIVYDQTNSTVDAEVQQLLDDHREAWMTGDVEALRAITTDAYSYDEVVYINDPFDGFKLNFKYTGDFDDAVADLERGGNTITRGEVARWTIEQVGDPIVRTDENVLARARAEPIRSRRRGRTAQDLLLVLRQHHRLPRQLTHSCAHIGTYASGRLDRVIGGVGGESGVALKV